MQPNNDDCTLFVRNLTDEITEELLYELFLQAGPLKRVTIPKDKDGKPRRYAFINFRHNVSVPYSIDLMRGVRLFGKLLDMKPKAGPSQERSTNGHKRSYSCPEVVQVPLGPPQASRNGIVPISPEFCRSNSPPRKVQRIAHQFPNHSHANNRHNEAPRSVITALDSPPTHFHGFGGVVGFQRRDQVLTDMYNSIFDNSIEQRIQERMRSIQQEDALKSAHHAQMNHGPQMYQQRPAMLPWNQRMGSDWRR